jgi:hypothetical protein
VVLDVSCSSSEGYAEGMADATAEETIEDWGVVARLLITDGKASWCNSMDRDCKAAAEFFAGPRRTRCVRLPRLVIVMVCRVGICRSRTVR